MQTLLSQVEKILVPLHFPNHWCLAVINVRGHKFEFYDSLWSDNITKESARTCLAVSAWCLCESHDQKGWLMARLRCLICVSTWDDITWMTSVGTGMLQWTYLVYMLTLPGLQQCWRLIHNCTCRVGRRLRNQCTETDKWVYVWMCERLTASWSTLGMYSYDCGVFAMKFAEYLSQDWPLEFGQNDMPVFRKRIALSIARNALIW